VAAALAATLPEACFRFSGTGVLDATRIAAGDPELWTQIFFQNRANMLAALDAFVGHLTALGDALRLGDAETLKRLLALAKKNRDALGS
jgi:prephenate dehydrogenase